MSRAAQRYAGALADVALKHNQPREAGDGLDSFLRAWRESADLRNVMLSPAVSQKAKHLLADKLAAAMQLAPLAANFVHVLLRNSRLELLPEIREDFEEELRRRQGIAQARISSAAEMTEQEKAELLNALEKLTGKRIEASYLVDPGLIGGAMVRIGSTIYDGSVREKLTRLQTQLETSL